MPLCRAAKGDSQRERTLGRHLGDRSGCCSRSTAWRSSSASRGSASRGSASPGSASPGSAGSALADRANSGNIQKANGANDCSDQHRRAARSSAAFECVRQSSSYYWSGPHRSPPERRRYRSRVGSRSHVCWKSVVQGSAGSFGCKRSGGSGCSQAHGLGHLALPSGRYRPSHGALLGPPHDLYCERGRHRRCDVESDYNHNRLFLARGRRRLWRLPALRRSWLSGTPLRTALGPRPTKIRLGPPSWPADWRPTSPPPC